MEISTEKIIQELFKTRHKFWNIHPDSATVVSDLIKAHKPENILEIGTSNGLSAILMGSIAEDYGGKVTSIEFFEKRVEVARDNILKSGLQDVVEVVHGEALQVIPQLEGMWDFVFMDAGKEYYLSFYDLIKERLTENAIIVADNTISHARQVKPFVEVMRRNKELEVKEMNIGEGLLIARRL